MSLQEKVLLEAQQSLHGVSTLDLQPIEVAVFCLAIIVFNFATLKLLHFSLGNISFKSVLLEKKSVPLSLHESSGSKQTSYSRVSGMVGAIVLATFLWSLGNIVLFKAIAQPDDIGKLLENVGAFFLAGASLFAPYAFNQLKNIFGS